MKKFVLLILAFCANLTCSFAQVSESVEEEEVFTVVETMPEFPGGRDAMERFITRHIQAPVIEREPGLKARVVCQFIVEKDGKISNIEVSRSAGDQRLNNEAVHIIEQMPLWNPGKQNGEPVRVRYSVPITFTR